MSLQPEDWNVVVLGRWNPALFTPAAIARRIFGLPEGTPVEVFVVLDDVQPPRVRHEGLLVTPSFNQLIIAPEKCTFTELDRTRRTARDAVGALPQTPFFGAGYNLRYRADELPRTLLERFSDDLDRRFSDQDFQIVARDFHRTLVFGDGRLMVRVVQNPDGRSELLLNFDIQSKDADQLRQWLELPIANVEQAARRILVDALALTEDDCVFEHVERPRE